mmetsp:Transcript_26525/g.47014  ORF Transcript_26525/g.47014 Transcript_26525/m.47014 type:complete len:225 (+) Transcript_26525:933-1607(+)
MMHDVHEPQSAKAATTCFAPDFPISSIRSSGHGRENVGLQKRRMGMSGYLFLNKDSRRLSIRSPFPLEISIKAIGAFKVPSRGARVKVGTFPSNLGSRMVRWSVSRVSHLKTPLLVFICCFESLASTWRLMGSVSLAIGPSLPAPNPGQKAENLPAPPPATMIWNESGDNTFDTSLDGNPINLDARQNTPTAWPRARIQARPGLKQPSRVRRPTARFKFQNLPD